MPTIKVPPVLRPQTDGEAEVSVDGGTVGDALRALAERYPETGEQLFSPEGELNRYVNVYLNDEDVTCSGRPRHRCLGVGHGRDPARDGGRLSATARLSPLSRRSADERVPGGLGSMPWVNRPVWLNQMPPGRSRQEYQITPAILRRLRFFASSPNVLRT